MAWWFSLIGDVGAGGVAKLNQSEWLSAAWLAHEMPKLVVFVSGVAAIVSARYAHTADRT